MKMINLNRRVAVISHDMFMVAIAWNLAWLARYNFSFPFQEWEICLYTLPFILVIQGVIFAKLKLYRGIWRFASIPDLWNIFKSAFLGTVCSLLILFLIFRLEGAPVQFHLIL